VPANARRVAGRVDPNGTDRSGIFATPAAVGGALPPNPSVEVFVRIDPSAPPSTLDLVRNAAAAADPMTGVVTIRMQRPDREFAGIRRALFAGALATLALIGASLLVTALEQLRERRRVLAVLVAFGTKRSTLGWSVLWQAAVPVVLGLLLAIAFGVGLGAVLLAMVREPVGFSWASIAGMAGAGAGVILAVTALSLPPLWRLMRPDGLRTE
jgi:predicted lysophospholipase L1 biosynthesis ABC-type transport system permease subunit